MLRLLSSRAATAHLRSASSVRLHASQSAVAASFSSAASDDAAAPATPKTAATWKREFRTKLEEVKEQSFLGGGEKRIAKQHEKGKLTARERIELLFDKDR